MDREWLKQCRACEGTFAWNDNVIIVDDGIYHEYCVELIPQGYYAFLDHDPLGEVENGDGDMAFEVLKVGEYQDE